MGAVAYLMAPAAALPMIVIACSSAPDSSRAEACDDTSEKRFKSTDYERARLHGTQLIPGTVSSSDVGVLGAELAQLQLDRSDLAVEVVDRPARSRRDSSAKA